MKSRHSGRGMPALVLAGLLLAPLAAIAQPNAWQITDNSSAANSTLGYTNILSAAQGLVATNNGFRLTVNFSGL